MSSNDSLRVLWIARSILVPQMFNIVHTHDYFHFNFLLSGQLPLTSGTPSYQAPITCFAPGVPHSGFHVEEPVDSINVMFHVPDKELYTAIASFPFHLLKPENAYIPLLMSIVEQAHSLSPDESILNAGFSYYLHLVMLANQSLRLPAPSHSIINRCMSYIDQHFSEHITLDNIAAHVGRNRSYVSTLFSNNLGFTLVEYLNRVRIKHACNLISYTDTPLPMISEACGFTNQRNFGRVFKSLVGTTPHKYRTSHSKSDLRFDGDINDLKRYVAETPFFTYVAFAQKRIDWKTAYDFIMQSPSEDSINITSSVGEKSV